MSRFFIEETVLKAYQGNDSDVVIPDGVTAIGDHTFNSCTSLHSVTIPETVTSIGKYAFYRCENLRSVTVKGAVAIIDHNAFEDCYSLTVITLPEGLQSIGHDAFLFCKSLPRISIPNSTMTVGSGAFGWCGALSSVSVAEGLLGIGEGAFLYCKSLTEIKLPNSLRSLGKKVFCGCEKLNRVVLPFGLPAIEKDVFAHCGNLRVLVAGLSSCSDSQMKRTVALSFCREPQAFGVGEQTEELKKHLFSRKKKLLPEIFKEDLFEVMPIFVDAGKINKNTVDADYLEPAMAAKAGQCVAFLLDWKNRNVSAGDAEKSLVKELEKDPYHAADMKKLWSHTELPDGGLCITSYKGDQTEVSIPERIGKQPVTALADESFSPERSGRAAVQREKYRRIVSLTVPNGVTAIGERAFGGCIGLSSITIPGSVSMIGSDAFAACGKDLTVHAAAGSYGERYARENHIPIIAEQGAQGNE